MQETFIELVPRSQESLIQEMEEVEAMGLSFHGYNLPELRRQKSAFLTPEEMAQMNNNGSFESNRKIALHLRTQERTEEENCNRIRAMAAHGINIALLVTGDAFDPEKEPNTCAHSVLRTLTEPIDDIEIAVAADLYMPEWGRWQQKTDAIQKGVVGSAFTQPVFSDSLFDDIDQYTQPLSAEKVYAGITWITNNRSRKYWNTMNNIPLAMLPTGESDATIRENSISQSADMLRLARQRGYSTYIMLMKGTIQELEKIFSLSENIREH